MQHVFDWVEIPTTDFNRAIAFYQEVFGYPTESIQSSPVKMAFFPSDGTVVAGALVYGEAYTPASNGVKVYFHCGDSFDSILQKVVPAGGKIIRKKTLIRPDIGYKAEIMDSEGNVVALHARR